MKKTKDPRHLHCDKSIPATHGGWNDSSPVWDRFIPHESQVMMTSSNGNIFRVTGPLCGEFTGDRWIPITKASDAELWCFFDLRLNKRMSKQSWGWWLETSRRSLWRHCNGIDLSHQGALNSYLPISSTHPKTCTTRRQTRYVAITALLRWNDATIRLMSRSGFAGNLGKKASQFCYHSS